MAEVIETASIVTETRERYFTYAMSVIQSRALPDVRDGLKPVQRRILYVMYHDLHLYADAKHRKCAKIVGDVTGNYHPHGEDAVYEALVRMAQGFVLRMPLVEGQGNFGSVSGDPPAARRYTEARLTAVAGDLMAELRQQTVDMRPNYDATTHEPVVLPAQFPNLLVNGCAGIAVGLATNIPPHNLNDVIKAAVLLIDEPEATTAQLLDKLKGPDFPLGGKIVTDRATLRKIYEEGSGTIKIQGEWRHEKAGRKEYVIVTSIPYGVNLANILQAMGDIIEAKKLPQLLDVTDLSDGNGLKVELEIKPGTDPEVVMAYLFRHTDLQQNFSYNMTCLVPRGDGGLQPVRGLNLKEMLRHFLDFRLVTVRRRFEYELAQLRKRIHILEGFRVIFEALDEAIKIIRESKGKPDAQEKLIARFLLDEVQATAVLDAQLYKIAQLEIKKILEELKEKRKEAARIEAILGSERKLWEVIKTEMTELGDKYAQRRRTKLASSEQALEFDPEAYIVRENTNVVLTRDGWVKRVGRLSFDEQNKVTTRVREGDEVLAIVPASTHDHVVFLTDDGTAYTMRVNELPAGSGYGEPIAKFFRLPDQAKVVGLVSTDPRFVPAEFPGRGDDPPAPYLLAVTSAGMTLRTPLAPFRTASTKVGRRYVRLGEGDRVVLAAALAGTETSLLLAAASGHVIHFPLEEVNVLSGAGKGVTGIKLEEGDACLGGLPVSHKTDTLQVETSNGKVMDFKASRQELVHRGGKGFEAVKRSSFVRIVPPPFELVDWDSVGEAPAPPPPKPAQDVDNNGDGTNLFGE